MEDEKKLSEIVPFDLFTTTQKKRLDAAIDIRDNKGTIDKALFQHSILCGVFLPYRNPGDTPAWARDFRNATINLNALSRQDPVTKEFKSYGLPYGANVRVIMAYLNTIAVRTQNKKIPLGDNLNEFIRAIGKTSTDGRTRAGIIDQLRRLSHSTITIGYQSSAETYTRDAGINLQMIEKFDFWISKDSKQRFLFPSFVEFGQSYFENLMSHAVPLDERAFYALSKDAMAMDIYTFMAHRLHALREPQKITWKALKDQFGTTYKTMKDFKKKFREKLKKVHLLYPDAKFEEEPNRYITFYNSPPPIRKSQIQVLK